MEIHFVNVGFGNMTLLRFPSGTTWLYDCHVTDENESETIGYLRKVLGQSAKIDVFICSHRDADHMRGVKKIHKNFTIGRILDSDVAGTTTNSSEYLDYMELRRQLPSEIAKSLTYQNIGDVIVRWMNSKNDNFSDANDQSIVVKFEYKGNSVLLAGDTSYRPWKDFIIPSYGTEKLKASILLAAHHGSLTFFDDPSDQKNYYTNHIKAINPAMSIISVGPNVHALPDEKALELYEQYSKGSNRGNKVYTTEGKGNIKLVLKGDGDWILNINQ